MQALLPIRAKDAPSITELWNIAFESLKKQDQALIEEYEEVFRSNLIAGSA